MGCVEERRWPNRQKERACAELTEHETSMTAANDFAVRPGILSGHGGADQLLCGRQPAPPLVAE